MSTPNDAIVSTLSQSQQLLERFCADLTPAEYLHRPCAGGNCTAWLLGHLIMSERMGLARVGVTDLPALPEGFEKRFSREAEAPRAAEFGDVTILLPLFVRHRQLLIERVKALPVEALDRPLEKPHPLFATVGQAVSFAGVHVSVHAGQITIIRRSLGRPPLV